MSFRIRAPVILRKRIVKLVESSYVPYAGSCEPCTSAEVRFPNRRCGASLCTGGLEGGGQGGLKPLRLHGHDGVIQGPNFSIKYSQ